MLITLEETVSLINDGKILHIAADDSLLGKLPQGKWIGGTTPYFIGDDGGVLTKDKLFVNEIDFAEDIRIASYGKYNIFQIELKMKNSMNLNIQVHMKKHWLVIMKN